LVVGRAGAAFGMVLEAEDRQGPVGQSLDRSVVEVDPADEEISGRQAGRVDLELVVLAGDPDRARYQVLDRMVGPVMTEGQAGGRRPHRPAEDLVAEADAQQREAAARAIPPCCRARPASPGPGRRGAGPRGPARAARSAGPRRAAPPRVTAPPAACRVLADGGSAPGYRPRRFRERPASEGTRPGR